ncbi:MAG: hypothetical protein HY519_01630 [Candidatus Aenigmarchaeota archaeon]|nr:hypothetical protein [Candidatus Aenigmarchaeota archaeon]
MPALESLMERMIRRSFPELAHEAIYIHYDALDNDFMRYEKLHSGHVIKVDESLKRAPASVKKGGIAHELAHIAHERLMDEKVSDMDRQAYRRSKRYRTLDERNTDLEVILRGYGKQLLEFMRYVKAKGYAYDIDHGLALKEVRLLISRRPARHMIAIPARWR